MKQRIKQIVARKHFKDHSIYKVIDYLDGEIACIRAVRQTKSGFEYAVHLSKKEEDFIFSERLVELESGYEREEVLKTLNEYEKNMEKNIQKIIEATARVDVASAEFRAIAGHLFSLTRDEEGVGVPFIQYLYGDKDGRVAYNGPLPDDNTIKLLIYMELVERPYDTDEDQVYQIGQNEYVVLAKHEEYVVVIPLILQEEQDGQLSWVSNTDLLSYIQMDEEGNAHLIQKPEDLFLEVNDAQAFLGEKTKGITERVLHPN